MKEIKLSQDKIALVDDEDHEWLSKYKWSAHFTGISWYAERGVKVSKGVWKYQSMHRLIMNPPEGSEVDHRNGDGLDNQRSNLRLATHAQNQHNKRKTTSANATSRYKGVSWYKARNKWWAVIHVSGKMISLGRFDDEQEAARAYDSAAKRYFGEFALLNFPDEM